VLRNLMAETLSVYCDKIYETRNLHVIRKAISSTAEVCSVRHLDKRAGVDSVTKVHSELLGVWTLSIVRYSKKLESATFRKLDLFPSSGGGGGGTTVLGPLKRTSLNHWDRLNKQGSSGCYIPSSERFRFHHE
jgi:hypothetical protein